MSRTNEFARSVTQDQADHGSDHRPDHETKGEFWSARIARDLLEKIAVGDPESLVFVEKLVAAVLDDPLVQRALEVQRLVRERSPFVLVRAIELAEGVLGAEREDGREGANRRSVRSG